MKYLLYKSRPQLQNIAKQVREAIDKDKQHWQCPHDQDW
jgi:hypothetical protein